MKIAYFSDYFYPQIGGIQDSIMTLGKELGRRGHQIYFFVPYYSKKHYSVSNLPQSEPDLGENVKIFRIPSLPGVESVNRSRLALPGFSFWRRFRREHFDILHTQSFLSLGWASVLASRIFKLPLVGTNHLAAAHFVSLGKFYFPYMVAFYNRPHYVTAPSVWVFKAEMIPHGFHRPHEVISNPIDVVTFNLPSEEKEVLKNKFNFSGNVIVFGGRLAPEKKIDVMIKALPYLSKFIPDVELVLAGRGAEENNLKELGRKLGVEKRVKFLGNLKPEVLAEVFHASEIFVVTSESETQNMVMLQAMACGLPVIAVKAQALPEYVTSERGALIPPGYPQILAEDAAQMLKNPKEIKKRGLAGRKYVERFSPEMIATKWEGIYEKVMHNYR